MTGTMNLNDPSLFLYPELLYEGIKTLNLRLKLMGLLGTRRTEFGEKANGYRVELRMRYYF